LLLLAGSLGFVFAVLEAVMRVAVSRDDNQIERLASRKRPPPGTELSMGDLIRVNGNDRLVYELIPGISGRFQGKEFSINSLGMRDRERSTRKEPGSFRILVLGDSHTFGWGVEQSEPYPAVLEKLLNEAAPGCRFEVWNLGVPGYNTVMEVERFALAADDFQPDLVVINYVHNDMDLPNFLAVRPDPLDLRRSYLLEMVKRRIKLLMGRDISPWGLVGADADTHGRYVFSADTVPERWRPLAGWENMAGAYRRLARLAKERGIPALLLFNWDDYRARLAGKTNDARPGVVRELAAAMAAEGFVIVDVQERVVRYLQQNNLPASAVWILPKDSHTNAVRHRLVAEELRDRILPLAPCPAK
jgi:lysophospholipase L1-like esterase